MCSRPSSGKIRGCKQRNQSSPGCCCRQRLSVVGSDRDCCDATARGWAATARDIAARVARLGSRGGRQRRRAGGFPSKVARLGARHGPADAGSPQALRKAGAHARDVRALPGRRLGRRARTGLQAGCLELKTTN